MTSITELLHVVGLSKLSFTKLCQTEGFSGTDSISRTDSEDAGSSGQWHIHANSTHP